MENNNLTQNEILIIELHPGKIGLNKDIIDAVLHNQSNDCIDRLIETLESERINIQYERDCLEDMYDDVNKKTSYLLRNYVDTNNAHNKFEDLSYERTCITKTLNQLGLRTLELQKDVLYCFKIWEQTFV